MNKPVIPRVWLFFLNSSSGATFETRSKKQKCIEDDRGGYVCDDCDWNIHGECEGTCVEANEACSGRNHVCICRDTST